MMQLSPRLRLFLVLGLISTGPLALVELMGSTHGPALWLLLPVLAAAYALAAALARPLEELLAVARRIRAGELQARTLISDPLPAEIAQTLFDLAGRVEHLQRNFETELHQRTALLSRKADQLRTVGQVGQQVAAVLEPDALLHFVVRVMRGAFGYDLVAVLQRHDAHLVLAACAARGAAEVPTGRVFPLIGPSAPPLATCVTGVDALPGSISPLLNSIAARSELAVPLRLGERVLGVLVAQSQATTAFDGEDRFTLETIAGQVAVALENARLFLAERQLRDLSITEERNRMAREIHDTLAQGFMGIIMQLRAMQGENDPERVRFHREQAEALAHDSLQEARRSVWNLRPHPLEGRGLAGALKGEVESLGQRHGVEARLETTGDVDHLPPAAEGALLRIAQEALHNISKYAQAARVEVRLSVLSDPVQLTVLDDGVGFDPARAPQYTPPRAPAAGGLGLHGMAERAHLAGGSLQVTSAPGQGCRILVTLPLQRGEA